MGGSWGQPAFYQAPERVPVLSCSLKVAKCVLGKGEQLCQEGQGLFLWGESRHVGGVLWELETVSPEYKDIAMFCGCFALRSLGSTVFAALG